MQVVKLAARDQTCYDIDVIALRCVVVHAGCVVAFVTMTCKNIFSTNACIVTTPNPAMYHALTRVFLFVQASN